MTATWWSSVTVRHFRFYWLLDSGESLSKIAWITFVCLGVLGAIALLPVAGSLLAQSRNPDYSCLQAPGPFDLSKVVPEGGTGEWTWWPTGLTCRYPTKSGGQFVVGPAPVLSVALAAGSVLLVGGLAGCVVLSVRRRATVAS